MVRDVQLFSKSKFSAWLRRWGPSSLETEDAIDIEDIDLVLFGYLTGDLMTIEVKERNGIVRKAQKDTQNILRQLLMLSDGSSVTTLRGVRPIKYHGHHLIQFQNSCPNDGWIKLDNHKVTKQELITFLNFGRQLKRRY